MIRVEFADRYLVLGREALDMMADELEYLLKEGAVGDVMTCTVVEMTNDEFDALPEFDGWT